jgi:hypothetical protein
MTISKKIRQQDMATAFHLLVDRFQNSKLPDAVFSAEIEPFSKCANTTWQSMLRSGWLTQIEIKGGQNYVLTPSGLIEGLRLVRIPGDQSLQEQLGRFQGAAKKSLKGRTQPEVVRFENLLKDSGLSAEFVFNALECDLVGHFLKAHGPTWLQRGVTVRIPQDLGLPLAEHEKPITVQLNEAREERNEYRCSYCGAPKIETGSSPTPDGDRSYYDGYDCGRLDVDGQIDKPCPSAKFPQLEDYELDAFENVGKGLLSALIERMPSMRWKCEARPKTSDAAQFPMALGYGSSRKEAIGHVRASYEKDRQKYKLSRRVIAQNKKGR